MKYPPEAAQAVLQMIEEDMKENVPPDLKLRKVLWNLMTIRAHTLSDELVILVGKDVQSGPFKGLKLTNEALGQYMAPYILGTYEHELHPIFEQIIANDYKNILNIGCSVGYYAVGLARRMPHMVIEAYDTDPEARQKCADMAKLNNVEGQVKISGHFDGEKFAEYAHQKTLVLMDIVVELHDLMDDRISGVISKRFLETHDVQIIKNQNLMPDIRHIVPKDVFVTPFDQMLLGWEGRDGPTPWGVFIAKQH